MTPFRVEAAKGVRDFILRQAPEPRRALREGLRRLAHEQGDLKPLQGDFEGYHRLRVGSYRIVFRYETRPPRTLRCVLIERRALVYQVFADMVKDRLAERPEPPPGTPEPPPRPVASKKKAARRRPAAQRAK